MSDFVKRIMTIVEDRDKAQPEFYQAVYEVVQSLEPVIKRYPKYDKLKIIERMIEPERLVMFRVPWIDDNGELQINRGFRVQMNSAIGPYKGGLRFHPSVNISILKFLAFEQVFKNSLTTLPMGGGKGGSDFDPKGKSDNEVMRFCQSFMSELQRHIGPNLDVPAGDIGVGGREIGFLFGQYKKIKNEFAGILTGKGLNWGGSILRPEATGYGAVYFLEEILKTKGENVSGKSVAVSGFGNVAWGVCKKVSELGGKVVTLSGPDGFIHDPNGVSGEKIDYLLEMRYSTQDAVEPYAKKFNVEFFANQRPWGIKCDVAIPCATQNELDKANAEDLVKNGCKVVVEAANMPCTLEATEILLSNKVSFGPGKAANAGGVAVSGLEMSQNSQRLNWTAEEVDKHLKRIMASIHKACYDAAEEFNTPGNYVNGANIAGFLKVADAMVDQGFV